MRGFQTTTDPVSGLLLGFELAGKLVQSGKKLFRAFSAEGLYEILDYQSTVEVLDPQGKKAHFRKTMKVKYLQDDISSFTDFGWSDGRGLRNYKSSPGYPVDRYKSGHREYVVISLREHRQRGEVDDYQIQWDIANGFLKPSAYWQTDVVHKIKRLALNAILPGSRQPSLVHLEEGNSKRMHPMKPAVRLPDKRWKISTEIARPKLFEQYLLKWEW